MILRGLFLLKSNTISIYPGRNHIAPTSKDFLKYKCKYLKQLLKLPQYKIIFVCRTSNHGLAIEYGWWSTIPISRDYRYYHFCSYDVVKIEAHFVLQCPLHSYSNRIPSLFEKVVFYGGLKSFFQLDHHIIISLYLMEAIVLDHSRELASFTPTWCTFNPLSLMVSQTLQSITFHFITMKGFNLELLCEP